MTWEIYDMLEIMSDYAGHRIPICNILDPSARGIELLLHCGNTNDQFKVERYTFSLRLILSEQVYSLLRDLPDQLCKLFSFHVKGIFTQWIFI